MSTHSQSLDSLSIYAGQDCVQNESKYKMKETYGVLTHLLKEIPDTRSSHTNKQLHKL